MKNVKEKGYSYKQPKEKKVIWSFWLLGKTVVLPNR